MFYVVFVIKLFGFCNFSCLYIKLFVKNQKVVTFNTEMSRFTRFLKSIRDFDLFHFTHVMSILHNNIMYNAIMHIWIITPLVWWAGGWVRLGVWVGGVGYGELLLCLQFYDVLRQFGWHLGQRLLPAVHDTPLFTRTRVRARGLLVFDARTTFHRLPVEIAVCEQLKYNRKLRCISQSVTIAL